MAQDKYNEKMNFNSHPFDLEDDSQEGGGEGGAGQGGKGGQSGQIAFKDFLSVSKNRDDMLSPEERRHLLTIHKDSHEVRVKKQKNLREERLQVKEGKVPLDTYRQGLMNAGMNSEYKANPVLANKAQFSGIDRQVTALPNENVAETNEADRQEPENQYRLRYAPQSAPRFNPKPQYNG